MTDRFYRYNLDGTIDALDTCHTCGNPLDANENCTYCEWVANPYPYVERDLYDDGQELPERISQDRDAEETREGEK